MNLIENKIKRAINEAPYLDVEKLLDEPVKKMEAHDYITKQELTKMRPVRRYSTALGICAAFIFAIITYLYIYTVPYGHISLDINPSFQLTINRLSSVITLEALNDDGEEILASTDIESKNLKDTLTAILDSIVEKGYLSSENNAILVSIDNKSSKKAQGLLLEVDRIIKEYLSSHSISSDIKEKIIADNRDKKSEAKNQGMSAGKLELIYDIMEDNKDLSFDYLSGLSLKELILLEEKYEDIDDDDEDEDQDEEDEDEINDADEDEDKDEADDDLEDEDEDDDRDNHEDD